MSRDACSLEESIACQTCGSPVKTIVAEFQKYVLGRATHQNFKGTVDG